ncbi:MAG: bifunctional folylpolyglutamate synthase/dihydrofolate synthase, partial [Kiritimatiellae bacterium]|nr:bifunctional folylpolyglutamate synthase/dihydrofolate synthase [Kiritimatiellia bacterium]
TVPLANPRGLPPEKLAAFARGAGLREVRACATLAEGLSLARDDARAAGRPVLVAGSLFLAGDVLSA